MSKSKAEEPLSEAEETLALHIEALGLPQPERQYLFAAPERKWAADFAWPAYRLLVEVEGFGHHKLNRYFGDIEKYNEAAMRGWWLLRLTSAMVNDGRAYQTLERFFGADRRGVAQSTPRCDCAMTIKGNGPYMCSDCGSNMCDVCYPYHECEEEGDE